MRALTNWVNVVKLKNKNNLFTNNQAKKKFKIKMSGKKPIT